MPLDEDDFKQIQRLIADSNKAMFAELTRQNQEADAKRKAEADAQAKADAEAKAKADAEAKAKAEEEAAAKAGPDAANDLAAKKLERQIAQYEARIKEAETKAQQAEEQRKAEALRSSLSSAVGQHYNGPAAANVMARLQFDGRIGYTEDGEPGIVFDRGSYKETLPLKAGMQEFVDSDVGKSLLPPRNLQGTGDGIRRSSPVPRKDGKVDWDSLKGRVRAREFLTIDSDQ